MRKGTGTNLESNKIAGEAFLRLFGLAFVIGMIRRVLKGQWGHLGMGCCKLDFLLAERLAVLACAGAREQNRAVGRLCGSPRDYEEPPRLILHCV